MEATRANAGQRPAWLTLIVGQRITLLMDLLKKIVVVYYMMIVAFALFAAYTNVASFGSIVTVFSIAVVPVAISAMKTANFWRDDPNSVASVERRHSKEKADMSKTYEARIEDYRAQLARALKTKPQQVKRGPYGMPEK